MDRWLRVLGASCMSLASGLAVAAEPAHPKLTRPLLDHVDAGPDGAHVLAWVYLTDKGPSPRLATDLSARAQARRLRRGDGEQRPGDDVPVHRPYVDAMAGVVTAVRHPSRWLNAVSVVATRDQVLALERLPFVLRMDLVDRVQEHPDPVLASPVAAAAPRVRRSGTIDYGPSRGQLDMLRVPVAHEVGLQGQGTLVAVIDSGFDGLAHPAFAATQVADRWDFVDGDTIVEGASHGTTTFSVIGGYHPGHLVGVAFGARFLLARVGPSEDEMVAAVEWAEARGADVVTMSVGVEMGAERMDGRTASITIAADRAVERGVVVVMSAGNFGYSPAANTLAAPADGFGVLGVGAVHPSGPWAIFSSVGPTADGRIKPDLVAQGVDVQVAWPFGVASYRRSSGTSYSCPLVAGVGALLLQAHPDWTPGQVANALRETASRAAQPDNRLGWGIPDVVGALSYEP